MMGAFEEMGLVFGQAGGEEDGEVAWVEEGVVDARGDRVDGVEVADGGVECGSSVFREVVDVQEQAFAAAGEKGDGLGEGGVFAERVVVDVPDVGS